MIARDIKPLAIPIPPYHIPLQECRFEMRLLVTGSIILRGMVVGNALPVHRGPLRSTLSTSEIRAEGIFARSVASIRADIQNYRHFMLGLS